MADPATPSAPLLVMEGIEKSFPGVRAVKNARLDLYAGEVLALLGENGAGKSTLIKVLAGAVARDGGTIRLGGRPAAISSPLDARRAGIAVIYQEFNLVATLSARENIFLGRERTRAGFFSRRRENAEARALFARVGVRIDPESLCRDLTIAQQQVVEIAKALSLGARIIVMDEPSATLTSQEADRLFAVIGELKAAGIAVIYISHRLEEVFRIADRATVMRDGEAIGTRRVRDLTRESLIEMMVGRPIEKEFPKAAARLGEPRLVVEGLARAGSVRGVSFCVRRGEVLGLTGLVGAGRTEVARLIFGADRRDGGAIRLDGRLLRIRSPRDAIRQGICLLTEDRKSQGLVLGLAVRENFSLPNLGRFSRAGFVCRRREREAFARHAGNLSIKVPSDGVPTRNLSGGTQQKVVLAKWLESNSEVIIFDEPTRGIDVGTKYEIYLLINDLAAAGKSIIMISSELPEVIGMSDRILVMHEGCVSGEIADPRSATQEQILALAVG
jgi:ABC-type sugar transport system ATPase subunit